MGLLSTSRGTDMLMCMSLTQAVFQLHTATSLIMTHLTPAGFRFFEALLSSQTLGEMCLVEPCWLSFQPLCVLMVANMEEEVM